MAKAAASIYLETIKAAVALASKSAFDHLLCVSDHPIPEELFKGHPKARKKPARFA